MKFKKLTKPLYEGLPFVFFLGGVALLIQSNSIAVTLFACFLFCYGIYISALRVVARDSIAVDCVDEILAARPSKQRFVHGILNCGRKHIRCAKYPATGRSCLLNRTGYLAG